MKTVLGTGDAADRRDVCIARDEERAVRGCVLAGQRGEFFVNALVAEIDRKRRRVGAEELGDGRRSVGDCMDAITCPPLSL